MNYREKYEFWLNNVKDKKMLEELKSMNENEIQLAFFKDIAFETAGLRGIVGAGSNCMNIYTVGRVAKAISIYMQKIGGRKIAISYDSRNMSYEFAKLSARIFASYGIKVYLAKKLMPTPFLSYMVRFYKCDMGVNVTASHNPKDYNGYKVYDSTGCQLLDEPSYEIIKIANGLELFNISAMSFNKAKETGLVVLTDDKVLDSYIKEVEKQSLQKIEGIKVVYTALNGTGMGTLPRVLKERGAKVVCNKVQCKPDKNFTTCPYPNPERDDVYESSIAIAKENGIDLIVASDPDADRLGVAQLVQGNFVRFTGNEIGVLLADYLFSSKKTKDKILVKSIVSTPLADLVAEKYDGKVVNVLTGFKYIGEFIYKLEKEGREKEFLLGFEESSGYLSGSYVRDKDATVAAMLVLEYASKLKKVGKTLFDRLNEIYDEFGYYQSKVYSFRFEGESGFNRMKEILENFRKNTPKSFAGFKVNIVIDYENGVRDLPKANVLEYILDGGAKIIVRPSGTEPNIKVYVMLNKTKQQNETDFNLIKKEFDEIMK